MKPVILIFTAFYIPGYRGGGPIQTVANMVECLSEDFDFRIITSDRDLGDNEPYPDIEVDDWNSVGKAKVFYTSPGNRSFLDILRHLRKTPHDLIYLNSFFGLQFTLFPLLALRLGLVAWRPFIIAPRGEFSKGALGIKAWKKRPFIYLVRFSKLFNDAYWHASTDSESNDVKRSMFVKTERISVASNVFFAAHVRSETTSQLSDDQTMLDSQLVRHLKVCFLSRISPKKNLDFALKILKQVQAPIKFKIFGPKEDNVYWDKCQALISSLPVNIQADYCGSIDHDQVKSVISEHDLFFVPTRGENFGHVYMESLSAGVPILVSDQTPWRGLEAQGIGWDISLDRPDKFVEAIEVAAKFSGKVRCQMKLNCLEFAQKRADDPSTLATNRALFLRVLTESNHQK